jgi:hypothetical protein
MILKFWPCDLENDLKIRPVDFILDYIFKINGFHWSKWAIYCLIWKTFIFQWNESFPNKTIYSSFQSVETADFKNVIWNKIHWADFEAAEV